MESGRRSSSSGWVSTISCFSSARTTLGGTWYVNHYPGLAVDVPTTSYSYFFEPNPNWSRLFSTGTEIKAVRRRRRRQVRRAPPHPVQHDGRGRQVGRGRRRVAGRAGRRRDAHRAISDHRHRLPVPAADPGRSRASPASRARSSTPPTGTTVTTRPTAASASSAPARRPSSSSPNWPGRRPTSRCTSAPRSGWCEGRRAVLRTGQAAVRPAAARPARHPGRHRRAVRVHGLRRRGAPPNIPRPVQHRRKRFGQDVPVRHDPRQGSAAQAHPDYDFGCKRPTFSNSYYQSFNKSTVHLQDSGINRIEPDGIVANDGSKAVIDTLVLATDSICGRPTSRPSRSSAATAATSESGGGKRDSRPTRVSPCRTSQLPQPGQPLRLHRPEFLQHDGVPDAAHGSAVR